MTSEDNQSNRMTSGDDKSSINTIEFVKDPANDPKMPNRNNFTIQPESLKQDNDAMSFNIIIKSGEHASRFNNYVTFQKDLNLIRRLDGNVNYDNIGMNLYIMSHFTLAGDDKDDLGYSEMDYLSQLSRDDFDELKQMIAYETIDMSTRVPKNVLRYIWVKILASLLSLQRVSMILFI